MTAEVITHSIPEYMKISNGKGLTMVRKLLQALLGRFGFVANTPNEFLAYPFTRAVGYLSSW